MAGERATPDPKRLHFREAVVPARTANEHGGALGWRPNPDPYLELGGVSNGFAMQTPKISRRRQQRFLVALAKDGNVASAAAAAQVDPAHLEAARRMDQAFAGEWEAAERAAARKLEQEAWRRAVVGVPEPLISDGKVVRDEDGRPVSVQRYSDTLLIEMLRMNQSGNPSARKFWLSTLGSHLMKRPVLYLIVFVGTATSGLAFLWLHNHLADLVAH